ncbi:HTH-type transcriptional regulator ArgP [Chitinimonas koreensis]|uniref:HTH-type transcriptional regulator ArgP n=1 Tax=Chitinimonas koreensis TaxID=356302 RepID=UPI00040845E0|nr:HTH-type transcriptional regulator ArgP [Chitinimonas koreensis]QNM95817.1 HTH-type transcriptional regulator ArgP [Chitinimonas koreensis]
MNLDRKHTDAFLAVIDTGSFEQAAGRLHVTPSAVSQRVRALESQLGNPLVVRTRPCHATRLGQRLLQYLRRARLLEEDLVAELAGEGDAPLNVVMAVNADTLATWFFPALADELAGERVLLELSVDDQDHTYALLESGRAVGCVSTEPKPMRGCSAEPLGAMRYRLVAAPDFAAERFPAGLQREAARRAPVVAFNRKDMLQSRFLAQHFALQPGNYPCHYVPVPGPRLEAIARGLGYGMVPELQLGEAIAQGLLIDLAPDLPTDVMLYWHTWKVQSPRMEYLSARIVAAGQRTLLAGPAG